MLWIYILKVVNPFRSLNLVCYAFHRMTHKFLFIADHKICFPLRLMFFFSSSCSLIIDSPLLKCCSYSTCQWICYSLKSAFFFLLHYHRDCMICTWLNLYTIRKIFEAFWLSNICLKLWPSLVIAGFSWSGITQQFSKTIVNGVFKWIIVLSLVITASFSFSVVIQWMTILYFFYRTMLRKFSFVFMKCFDILWFCVVFFLLISKSCTKFWTFLSDQNRTETTAIKLIQYSLCAWSDPCEIVF